MRRWRKAGIAIVVPTTLLLVNGCAGFFYERALDSWQGAPIQELVDSWGPAHEQYRDNRGNMVYQWSHRDIDGGRSKAAFQYRSGKQKVSPFCRTRFTVDENDIVRHWTYFGNDCSGAARS